MRARTTRVLATTIAIVAAAGFVAAGCGDDDATSTKDSSAKLSGTITADGSSTVFPISQALAEEFQAENGDVEVSVGTSGTGGGFEKFCRGETDISNASRPIKDEEIAACEEGGVEYVELTVATDGLSVVVNPENDAITCLTIDQLKAIWEPKSTVKNWKDVDPSFPDLELALYGPGTDSGTFDYFTDEVNGEEGASRSDYTASEDDNVLVQGVAGDEGALGYFGHSYAEENKDKVTAIGIDSGDGCVEPTTENIESGKYTPLSRPLFVYIAKKSVEKEQVKAFVDFTIENVNDLVADVGFIQVADDALAKSKSDWEAFATA